MNFVARINLKTATPYRDELIDFCLKGEQQYLAIGWSRIYGEGEVLTYSEFYERLRQEPGRLNTVLNIFKDTHEDNLFWTRDLDGNYWICRAKGVVLTRCDKRLDIGALLPIDAYNFGMQVPGQIKAAFNRANAGTAQKIYDAIIVEYSKAIYNKLSQTNHYDVARLEGSLLDNLPDFDLEELVISYIQVNYDYYVLSNSIASKSTTIKVECEFLSRDPKRVRKAVVQVKGRKAEALDALQFADFTQNGYEVFLFAPEVLNADKVDNIVVITPNELIDFYENYKVILPDSITQWENLY